MPMLSNALVVLAVCGGTLYLGYKVYGGFLTRYVFGFDDSRETPAHTRRDGVDFVPTHPAVLFGHHFASIAGLGPIVGPAIAVFWGWVPALIWVVLGCILIGGVHDTAALFASLRHRGRTLGDLTNDIIGPRARVIFLVIIFFLLALAMGVFALLMSKLFTDLSPQAVIPTFSLIVIAMVIGLLVYRRKWRLGAVTLLGVGLMFVTTMLGLELPVPLYRAFVDDPNFGPTVTAVDDPDFPQVHGIKATRALATAEYFDAHTDAHPEYAALAADVREARDHGMSAWTYILLAYALLASILPVWLLLQPRDYINSYQLYIGLVVLMLGVLVWHPQIVGHPFGAPTSLSGADRATVPGPWPFLFITVACGAISGFHNQVSSGTTARQIRRESDAKLIGYGAMLMEGLLAVIVVLVCVAGLSSAEFQQQYGAWQGLGGRALGAFLVGASHVVSKPFLPLFSESSHAAVETFCLNFVAVVVVSFAMTTLDSGTRLLRFNVEAIGKLANVKPLQNRYLASLIAVAAIGYFALMKIGGQPAGLVLWQLFGTTNQLLAVLGLLVAAVYLFQIRRPVVYLVLPMGVMLLSVTWAMTLNLRSYYHDYLAHRDIGNGSLLVVGAVLAVLTVWMVIEAVLAFLRGRGAAVSPSALAEPAGSSGS
jgi:carbon starvation protein